MSSEELDAKMDRILGREIVNRHSYFQLKYFVVGKEYTLQSKMWCCVRELNARKQSIVAMQAQLDDLRDEISLADIDIERMQKMDLHSDELNTRERVVRISKRERQKRGIEQSVLDVQRKLRDAQEEANFFVQTFDALAEKEELKPYDDLPSQTAYWNEKLTQEVYLRTLLNHPLDLELIKTILSIKDDSPIKIETLNMLEARKKQLTLASSNQAPQLEKHD